MKPTRPKDFEARPFPAEPSPARPRVERTLPSFNVRSGLRAGPTDPQQPADPVKTGSLAVDVVGHGAEVDTAPEPAPIFNVRSGLRAGPQQQDPDDPVKTGSLAVDVAGSGREGEARVTPRLEGFEVR